MTNATIRVGIVGAGGNTKAKHIPGLRAIENVEITGVCNRSRASSEAVAAEFGIPRVFDDWRKLVEDPDYRCRGHRHLALYARPRQHRCPRGRQTCSL
jgi:predicted dehydrogenase